MTRTPRPDNPFAHRRRRWFLASTHRRRRWFSGWAPPGALLLIVAAGILAGPSVSKRFLLTQLTRDVTDLPSDAQNQRLRSIGQLGKTGIPFLVATLASEEGSLARGAFDALRDTQRDVLPEKRLSINRELVDQLSARLTTINDYRWNWVRTLASRVLTDTVGDTSAGAEALYRDTTALLARLSSVEDPTRAIAATEPVEIVNGLATTAISANENLQNGNGPAAQTASVPSAVDQGAFNAAQQLQPVPTRVNDNAYDGNVWTQPSISGGETDGTANDATLSATSNPPQLVDSDLQPVMIARGQEETSQRIPLAGDRLIDEAASSILNASNSQRGGVLVGYSTRAVIDLLVSVRPALATAARRELQARNFSEGEVELALRLASSNAAIRLVLIDELPHRSDIDPRTWLLWLAEDSERSVRLRALSTLATMNDPNVTRRLRELMLKEQDPSVAAQIRQALLR